MTSKLTYGELEQRVQTLEKKLAGFQTCDGSERVSKQYLEAIINNTNMPICLKNAEYKYIFMNRQLRCLAHVPHDQIQGMDDFDIKPYPCSASNC